MLAVLIVMLACRHCALWVHLFEVQVILTEICTLHASSMRKKYSRITHRVAQRNERHSASGVHTSCIKKGVVLVRRKSRAGSQEVGPCGIKQLNVGSIWLAPRTGRKDRWQIGLRALAGAPATSAIIWHEALERLHQQHA